MLSADWQVYSYRPDLHWLDEANRCQNDWRLFSRDDFFQSKAISPSGSCRSWWHRVWTSLRLLLVLGPGAVAA